MEQPGPLLAELARILQLVEQMESHLHQHSAGESCKPLLQKILSSVQSSILMAKSSDPAAASSDSPNCSAGGSQTTKAILREEMTKKRKTLPKWSSEVRVGGGGAAGGFEGPVDDDFSWRKYGQKVILGAQHPRGYYRCTHRMTRGCPATKQVQRSDEDPLLFHVTYHGNHTCLSGPQNEERKSHQDQRRRRQQQQQQQSLLSFQAGLRFDTEGFSSFAAENMLGSPSASPKNNCFVGSGSVGPSPAFLSPTTSDSTYFSISPHDFEGEMKLWSPESGADSPAVGMDLLLQELDFERDLSSFFS